jgi:dienelactone hydrolase
MAAPVILPSGPGLVRDLAVPPPPPKRSLLDTVYRRVRRFVLDPPGARLAMTVPRTLSFVAESWARGFRTPVYPDPPAPRVTPALVAQVQLDEFVLAAMKSPRRYPRRLDYERVGSEVLRGVSLYEGQGWLDDPLTYHRTPPPLTSAQIRAQEASARGLVYERITFESEYEPWPEEPGRDRWRSFEANHTAHAWVVRHHDDQPRPWLILVHGFGTGHPWLDFSGFRAEALHRELGLNLILPVLPLHGPRKPGRFSGTEFMSFDMMNPVLGMAQSTWDIRRLASWARAEGAPAVGIYGLSLGGYATALVASVEPSFDLAIAGIPATDLPALFAHHCPPYLRRRAIKYHLLGEQTHRLHRVISPLALHPQVPKPRRYIFAGLGDRMSTPKQAYRLWLHWDQPRLEWYGGNHVGFFWSGAVDRFVRAALIESGFAWPPRT